MRDDILVMEEHDFWISLCTSIPNLGPLANVPVTRISFIDNHPIGTHITCPKSVPITSIYHTGLSWSDSSRINVLGCLYSGALNVPEVFYTCAIISIIIQQVLTFIVSRHVEVEGFVLPNNMMYV